MTTALKLPGLDRGKQSVRLRESEAGIQQAIVQALSLLGYLVLSTSEHRRGHTCKRCGLWQVPAGGRGVDKGIPDLIVTRPSWPVGVWLSLEVKGPTTRISPEQKRLEELGRIVIVRSVDEAIEAVNEAARTMER